jgi:hypothetical protein
MSALDVQVGGDHYKKYKIQPMEYSMANGLDACQHTAIKYITRFRDKGGIADLEKAKHCIDLLIEFERKATAAETGELRERPWEVGTLLRRTEASSKWFTQGKEYEIVKSCGDSINLIDDDGRLHGWTEAELRKRFVRA